jgi:hypothetical protein
MSYSRSLRRTLRDKNEALFNRLEPIEKAAKSVLTYTTAKFPYYTPHDFSHSQNVEEILNWLVPDDVKTTMTDYEVFFLLVSSWLHDWGMVASETEKPKDVRKQHHIRTETNFEKLHDAIHLSLVEARICGRICRGHREDDLLDSIYDDSFFGSNILIRIRFLAGLLRVADECDVTANRTPEIIYYTLKPEGASEEEFQKHLSISGIGKSTPYKLQINGVAKTPRGVEVIQTVRNQIQTQLNSVKTILATHGVILDVVEAHIDTRGFINKPIEFELDRKNIVNLLIGSSLYSRADVAIRELLQNAVDTCRFRKIVESNFEPSLEIEFGNGKVSFEDNGVGMSFEDAFDYFSKKGHSFYVSKDFQNALGGRKFDPISKFGIGILSAFIMADKMVVETKKENCAPCRFTITDLGEGWTYEEGSRQEIGTKVTLFLNSEGKKLAILESLRHYAKNVTVPIFVKNLSSGKRERFNQSWGPEMKEVIEKVANNRREKFLNEKPVLSININNPDLEVTYHVFSKDNYYFIGRSCILLQNGIYVGDFDLFPNSMFNWIALIDCKSNLVDLMVSREDLVENRKYKSFLSILYDTLFQAAVLKTTKKCGLDMDELEKTVALSSFLTDFVGSAILCESNGKTEEIPQLKFVTARTYPVLLAKGTTSLSLEQIKSKQFKEIVHCSLGSECSREQIKLVSDVLLPTMNEETAVIFDFGPYVVLGEELQCGLCEALRSEKIGSRCLRLMDIMREMKFVKQNTAIDSLLPDPSFFASMPRALRGGVIPLKSFEFAETKGKLKHDLKKDSMYSEFVGRELFRKDSVIGDFFNDRTSEVYPGVEMISQGQFVFDCEDPFLRSIISEADYVLSDEPLRKSVERYFRILAVYSLGPVRLDLRLELLTLERTIVDLLKCLESYVPFKERISELAQICYGRDELP